MSQNPLRRISAALTLATFLALPAAAAARPARAEASFSQEAWRYLAGLFGLSPAAASGARRGNGFQPIVGKLGGYIDPDGRTTTLTTSTTTRVKP